MQTSYVFWELCELQLLIINMLSHIQQLRESSPEEIYSERQTKQKKIAKVNTRAFSLWDIWEFTLGRWQCNEIHGLYISRWFCCHVLHFVFTNGRNSSSFLLLFPNNSVVVLVSTCSSMHCHTSQTILTGLLNSSFLFSFFYCYRNASRLVTSSLFVRVSCCQLIECRRQQQQWTHLLRLLHLCPKTISIVHRESLNQ